MVDLNIWRDKLPEDKAKYFNRTRMSLELFCRKMYISELEIINDMRSAGFRYNKAKRMFEPLYRSFKRG